MRNPRCAVPNREKRMATKQQNQRPQTRVTKTMSPDQPGAIKLARQFGESLICVRYRCNAESTTRYTTVELLLHEAPIQRSLDARKLVQVQMPWDDAQLRKKAADMGALWDCITKRWTMPLYAARMLGLTERLRK